jgi:hypothetical protein
VELRIECHFICPGDFAVIRELREAREARKLYHNSHFFAMIKHWPKTLVKNAQILNGSFFAVDAIYEIASALRNRSIVWP